MAICRGACVFASEDGAGERTGARETDRILIVEDDLLIATQIETALTEAGFYVLGIAATGQEALEIAGKDTPDLAIVDIRITPAAPPLSGSDGRAGW